MYSKGLFLSWDVHVAFIVVTYEALGGRHNYQSPSRRVGEGEALSLSKITSTLAIHPLSLHTLVVISFVSLL